MNSFDELYAVVKDLPIVDWHNHLDWTMLAEDSPLGSLYAVWVKTDPYKHRAMRICGVPERLITGDAPEDEKWRVWMETLPKLVGNPIFAWAKLELAFLGLDAGAYLRGHGANVSLSNWTPSRMLNAFNVAYISPCLTQSQVSFLAPRNDQKLRIVPSLRMNAGEDVAEETLARFAAAGCRVVDINVDDADDLERHFDSLAVVAGFAAQHKWTMLLHLGALRATSARLRAAAGPVGGFAGMRAPVDPAKVAAFLNRLEEGESGRLPRTILLSLNPEAHAQLAVLAGSFVADGVPGKVQLGPAWWWCDHAEGIRDVFEKQAAYGVLSTFVGMTTDSRSLLSFVRHDYFRRLFCQWVAGKIAAGDFPSDDGILVPLLQNVCFKNALEMTKDE